MSKGKVIKMHFPVSFVKDWVHKWADESKKESKTDAERAMLDDVVTMIDIAAGAMVQMNGK